MIAYLAAALIAAQPAPDPGATSRVEATVGDSEWCPEGNVRLDLTSGRFHLTPRASRKVCQDPALARRVIAGKLGASQLALVRAAYAASLDQGLESRACRAGEPHDVIISNSGPRTLVVTEGQATQVAPAELGCWSEAATVLYRKLGETFEAYHER